MSEIDCTNSLIKSLNRLLDRARGQLAAAEARAAALEAERDQYRAALEFYADESLYACRPWLPSHEGMPKIDQDYGRAARAALSGQPAGGGGEPMRHTDDEMEALARVVRFRQQTAGGEGE